MLLSNELSVYISCTWIYPVAGEFEETRFPMAFSRIALQGG